MAPWAEFSKLSLKSLLICFCPKTKKGLRGLPLFFKHPSTEKNKDKSINPSIKNKPQGDCVDVPSVAEDPSDSPPSLTHDARQEEQLFTSGHLCSARMAKSPRTLPEGVGKGGEKKKNPKNQKPTKKTPRIKLPPPKPSVEYNYSRQKYTTKCTGRVPPSHAIS